MATLYCGCVWNVEGVEYTKTDKNLINNISNYSQLESRSDYKLHKQSSTILGMSHAKL